MWSATAAMVVRQWIPRARRGAEPTAAASRHDPTVSVEAFTTVLHMRDTISAHICAAKVLNNLGAVAGARRVLAEAAHVVLALCDAVARSRRGRSENQPSVSVALVACW